MEESRVPEREMAAGGTAGAAGGAAAANSSLGPPAAPTASPAVPPVVKLGLTVVYTLFYTLLFGFVYAQLWLVLRYRHKRFSYQTAFLWLCLLWAALRALLFSFYFRDCGRANALGPLPFWLLYCLPVCLQFFTLSLMNLYCAQVYFKAKSKYTPALLRYRLPLYLVFAGVSALFLGVNLVCALLVKTSWAPVKTLVLVRVTINDSLFVLCAISLSVCLYKVAKMSLASIYLESKGTSVCQVSLIGTTVILLYASRACYNLLVLALADIEKMDSFDYDWYNVSDQIAAGIPHHVLSSRRYFFDNPRRYDSDDDLAWSIPPQNASASLPSDCYDWGSHHSFSTTNHQRYATATTEELHPYP
ncbi:G protein-coupled receptor 137Ba-like isoform X2 [Gadus macrocephalus]|uniref:G protein-coupled receptor 137Ba-like isoform X2 n=1 Tax=Gadus macrocephalus TaxID=80720 RepID=UPI0028CB7620|nr:G protein-coupled receptor 137Ba-like isoform X2 [Gadus macrocephalus]